MNVHLLLVVALPLACGTARSQEIIEIFKLQNQRITAVPGNATVYDVDALDAATERLSIGLPNDPVAAQRIAQQRLQALPPQDKDYLRRLSVAVVASAEYKIAKVPAVVFDRRAVVYGVFDVEKARGIYLSWVAHGAGK